MSFKFSNFGQATLQTDVAAGDLSLNLGTAAVTKLPTLGVGEVVRLTLWDGVNEPEIVEASAISGAGVATVVRGQESTTARAWVSGTRVRCALTADLLTQAFSAIKVPSKYGTGTFSAGLYTITLDSITSFPQTGQIVSFLVPSASTGASTIRFTAGAGYTATYSLLFNSSPTAADDIKANQLVLAVFTGTVFEILSVANKITPTTGAITAPAFIPNGTSIPSAGMYAPTAGGVALAAGGAGRFFITSTGKIGIGTSTPVADLHIKNAPGRFTLEATGGTVPVFKMNNGTEAWEFLQYPSGLTEYFKGNIIREVANGTASVGTEASDDTAYMVYGAPTGTTQYGERNTSLLSGTVTSLGTLAASTLKTLITCTQFVQSYVKDIAKGAGASITTAIGLYVEEITAGATNWGIYAEGPLHYLKGKLFVGSSSTSNQGVFQIAANPVGGLPETTGTADVNTLLRIIGGSVAVDLGVAGTGEFWLQPRSVASNASNFDFLLCPNGGNLRLVTPAENDSSTKAATTAFVNPASSLAANGYVKLANGLIIQWGTTASVTAGSNATLTFPLAFPTNCWAVTITPISAGNSGATTTLTSSTPTTSNVTVRNWGSISCPGFFIAIGN